MSNSPRQQSFWQSDAHYSAEVTALGWHVTITLFLKGPCLENQKESLMIMACHVSPCNINSQYTHYWIQALLLGEVRDLYVPDREICT